MQAAQKAFSPFEKFAAFFLIGYVTLLAFCQFVPSFSKLGFLTVLLKWTFAVRLLSALSRWRHVFAMSTWAVFVYMGSFVAFAFAYETDNFDLDDLEYAVMMYLRFLVALAAALILRTLYHRMSEANR